MSIQESSTRAHPVIRKLRAERRSREISQSQLARDLGYNRTTIEHTESCKHSPSFNFVVNYADYLGYDLVLLPRKVPSQ